METNEQEQVKIDSLASHSILMPTIPIYHLQQTPSEMIAETQAAAANVVTPVNTINFLNIDVSTDGGGGSINENFKDSGGLAINSDNIDWSNSLFKPASRFSMSNRRECKSTSDETHVYELNGCVQSTKSSTNENNLFNFNLKKSNVLLSPNFSTRNHMQSYAHTTETFQKQIKGQFGYNPNSLKLLNTTKLNMDTSRPFKFTSKEQKNKVKRLSNSNKFSIDTFSKKHHDFSHNKKLFHAVSSNDYKQVVELLNTNMYDVNCCDDKQRTCLHIASSRGNLDIVRLLLEYGSNPNVRDCVSNLPIHLAIISSHVPVVTVLLEAGTDIHSLDLNGKTVLHLAGTRLRWLLNDENHKASPKLKIEAIMIMNMIKEYLRRKKESTSDLDMLADKLESVFNLDDISNLTIELLDKFETLNLKTNLQ